MKKGFENIKHWIFDLDDTLCDSSSHTFPEILDRMTNFLMDNYGCSRKKSEETLFKFYKKYGSTVRGLMEEGYLEAPDVFSIYSYDIDFSNIKENVDLREAILNLPGDKYVLTSAHNNYANTLIERLGLDGVFKAVWALEDTDLMSKPHEYAYNKLLEEFNINPKEAVMIEDSYNNSVAAKNLGLKAIWLNANETIHSQSYGVKDKDMSRVDIVTDDLIKTLQYLKDDSFTN